MTGHSPEPAVAAIARQAARGITAMLPGEDAPWVGEDLQRRFGLPHWQLTLSATDANRFAIRLCRQITDRSRVLVHNHCYHGSVDETLVTIDDGRVASRHGNIGPPVDPALTTRVVEINDLDALERELAAWRRRLRPDRARAHEHRHRAAGPGLPRGAARAHAARRDAARDRRDAHALRRLRRLHARARARARHRHARQGDRERRAAGAYGLSEEVAARVLDKTVWEVADVGGIGGTLAGNLLSSPRPARRSSTC